MIAFPTATGASRAGKCLNAVEHNPAIAAGEVSFLPFEGGGFFATAGAAVATGASRAGKCLNAVEHNPAIAAGEVSFLPFEGGGFFATAGAAVDHHGPSR